MSVYKTGTIDWELHWYDVDLLSQQFLRCFVMLGVTVIAVLVHVTYEVHVRTAVLLLYGCTWYRSRKLRTTTKKADSL